MAFHPFQTFRRHQKKWMAGLVIMCMFIFVLSSGIGNSDLIQRITQWLGTSRRGETKVATVYGKKVSDFDLDELRRQRELANTIINGMVQQAVGLALFEIQQKKGLDEFDELQKAAINQIMQGRMLAQFTPDNERRPQLSREHEQLQVLVDSLLAKNETEKARKIRQIMRATEIEMWARDEGRTETFYFGGSPKVNDLLDFVLWRHQAEKLGITLTPADIRADISREAFNYQPLEDSDAALVAHVQRMQRRPDPSLTAKMIYDALGDELRVYIAKCAVLGYPPGVRYFRHLGTDVHYVPATATPEEFWKFYQDNRTTLRVEMLPIKVSDFLSKVGQPPQDEATKEELRNLYERHKDDEFHPDLDQPAFKEPRRLSVEWVSLRQDSPQQRKEAENFMLSAIASGAAGNPLPAWALSTQIIEKYDRGKTFTYPMPGLLERNFELAFLREPPKAEDVASALGLAMGSLGTGTNPNAIRAGLMAGVHSRHRPAVAAAIAAETQRRNGVYATLVLSGLNPLTQARLLEHADRAEQALPLDVVKKDVMDQVRDTLARQFLIDHLQGVQTELEKLKGKPDEDRKKEAEKIVAKAIKDHGLSHGKTEKPRDLFDIEEDKGLKPMRDSYLIHPPSEDPRKKLFAVLFFGNKAPSYLPVHWPLPGRFGDNWQMSEEPFLYWTTEEQKAYTPTYEQAEKKVIEAWRMRKAGELALKEAERIQQEVVKVKEKGDGLKVLREESAKNPSWGEIFPLINIAKLVDVFTGGMVLRQYGPYKADEDKIKARADFVDQLLKTLKANGDATVVWNRPASMYYVVLLASIYRPDEAKFFQDYSNPHVLGENLWHFMEADRRKKFTQSTLEQLRVDAGAPKGKWEVSDEMRKRIEGRGSSDEE
jgi:hypothetical protein